MHGVVAYAPRAKRGKMDYQYELMRIWERPAEQLLNADIGALPLAVLGQLPAGVELEAGLSGVIGQVIDRVQREAAPEQLRRLLTSAYLLTGLRVPRETARHLFQGVRGMQDSDTYLAIIDEGRELGHIEEARKMILQFGKKSLGIPGEDIRATLAGIADLDRLEYLAERISEVKSWQELLATP